MFSNKHYAQALVAFQRAGATRQATICHAFLLRENARVVPDNRAKERVDAFAKAGEAFSTCANESLPHQERQRLIYYTNAAECFVRGRRSKEAGSCFVHAGKYSEAIRVYREGGRFDEMVEVLADHADHIEANLFAQLIKLARMNYFKVGRSFTAKD